MKEEIIIYWKDKWITNPSKWILFRRKVRLWFKKWKLVDTSKYCLIPWEDRKRRFTLSKKEYEDSQKLYKEKGTISYEFYPCAGIGWGVKIHVLKTGEIIDISDVDSW